MELKELQKRCMLLESERDRYRKEKKALETKLEHMAEQHRTIQAHMEKIRERNSRVEKEKAWESSLFRITLLVFLTYVVTSLVFWTIDIPRPMLNALIPTSAYYVSTLTLPFIRRWWIGRQSS